MRKLKSTIERKTEQMYEEKKTGEERRQQKLKKSDIKK